MHRHWEERRKTKHADEWEQIVGKTSKRGKSSEVFAKLYNPHPIKLNKQNEMLECDSEVEKDELCNHATTVRLYIPQWYVSMFSPSEEDCIPGRLH